MVHGIREGKIVWSRPEIVVLITLSLSRDKMMQHVLLGVHEVTKQWVVVVLDELSCLCSVSACNFFVSNRIIVIYY